MGCVHAKASEVQATAFESSNQPLPRPAVKAGSPEKAEERLAVPVQREEQKPKAAKGQKSEMTNHTVCPNASMNAQVPSHGYNLRYSYLSQRGYYPDSPDKANQDSFCVQPQFGGNPSDHFFGVFDGHGEYGTPCSHFARDKLPENLLKSKQLETDVVQAYHSSFVQCNAQLHRHHVDDSMSGTTGITILVRGRTLYCANVGDSRAVLAEKRGKKVVAVDLSNDQTPFRQDECARVKMCGARVLTLDQLEGLKDPNVPCWGGEEDDDGDPPRLWVQNGMYPGTAFTRSIGDTVAERIGVIAVPEVVVMELSEAHPFFVIASDGVFEFLSSQSVVDMVCKFDDPHDACAAIVAESYRLWLQYETRTDDITIIIVQIHGLKEVRPDKVAPMPQAPLKALQTVREKSSGSIAPGTPPRPVRRGMSKAKRAAIEGNVAGSAGDEKVEAWVPRTDLPPKTPEEMAKIESAVKANFLFTKLSDKQQKVLFDCMERVKVKAGEVVIRQGDIGDRFYIVESGDFEVLKADPGAPAGDLGSVVHRYSSKTNPCFGDLALMYNKPREATVRAVTEGSLWALERAAFRGVLIKSSRGSLLKTLRTVDVLQALPHMQLQRLADVITEVSFEDRATIVKQEEEPDMLYIVEKGQVEVHEHQLPTSARQANGAGAPQLLGPSQYFGDKSVLKKWTSSEGEFPESKLRLTAVANGHVNCLAIRSDALESVLGQVDHQAANRSKEVAANIAQRRKSDPGLPKLVQTKMEDLEWRETVYSTEIGEVGLVHHEGASSTYSLKRFSKSRVAAAHREQQVVRERELLQTLAPSAFIPAVVSRCSDAKYVGLLLHTRLFGTLSTVFEKGCSEKSARFCAASCVLALAHLHKEGVVYRGVSFDMLMLDNHGFVQLVDFRFAKKLSEGRTFTLCGMPDSLAPEMISGRGHGTAADWWALGVLIYSLLDGGEPPFSSSKDNELDIFNRISNREMRFPGHFSKTAVDLLEKLLVVEPEKRLGCGVKGVEELQQHPWFEGIDWQALETSQAQVPEEIIEKLHGQPASSRMSGGSTSADEHPLSPLSREGNTTTSIGNLTLESFADASDLFADW